MITLQTVQGHSGLTHPFYFFDIRDSGAQDLAPECPNDKIFYKGLLDQYGAERFGRLIFATIRKRVGLKG